MSKIKIEDKFYDTSQNSLTFDEGTRWDGHNHISLATGSQWDHETLYLSASGKQWYVVTESQRQGTMCGGRTLTPLEAASWLLQNEHELPPMLAELEKELVD